jgi:hypothetical protein
MAMDPRDYMAVMGRWLANFTSGPVGPVMGVSEDELKSYRVPALVVPGNDKTHASVNGMAAAELIPGAELYRLPIEDQPVDLIPFPQWQPHFAELAAKFAEFMRRHAAP